MSDLAIKAVDPIKGYIGSAGDYLFSPVFDAAIIALDITTDSTHYSTPGKPKAYLNWVLLDENFDGVLGYPQTGAIHAGDPDQLNTLAVNDIEIRQGGYMYIYTSNETKSWDVFFDNLSIKHYKGPFVEESHYYPFGLTMQGNNSKALRPDLVENERKFNGIEQTTDLATNQYDALLRTLDPQIGRWWQIDPKVDVGYEDISPYSSMLNNPIRYSDPLGDEAEEESGCCQGLKKVFASVSAAVIGTIDNNVPGSNLRGAVAESGIIEDPEVAESWNSGLDVADEAGIVQGVGESATGGGVATGSVAVTAGSGGLSIEVTGPTAAIGTVMVAHGAFVATKSASNLASQNGRVNVKSSNNSSSSSSGTSNSNGGRNGKQANCGRLRMIPKRAVRIGAG